MRRILLAVALLAGCASEADNVSLEGPARRETTTAAEPVETTSTETTEATTTTVAQPVEVARWSGDADTDTENFTVKQSWELHWRVDGGQYGAGVGVAWVKPGEPFPSDFLQIDNGEGSSLIREGGTFYMEISSFGSSYELWVVDVPN